MRSHTAALIAAALFAWMAIAQAEEGSSADEIARELANPNTSLASLNFKLQYREFQGDLPDAGNQHATTLIFQPSLPFGLENGDKILFRPAIPIQLSSPVAQFGSAAQPVVTNPGLDFDDESGLGDIVFDLAYARTTPGGLLLAGGIVASVPTATKDELGTDRWTLGPELLIGKITKKSVIGMYPNHQWDIGGSGNVDISLTSAQLFGIYLPDGGWSVGTSPVVTYDHKADQWTVPLNLTVGKTVMLGGRPWKFGMELNYYVEQADAFGPDWFVGISVAPVTKNFLAEWFK